MKPSHRLFLLLAALPVSGSLAAAVFWWGPGGTAARLWTAIAVFLAAEAFIGWGAARVPARVGREALYGARGVAMEDFRAEGGVSRGPVRIGGECWQAVADASDPPRRGDRVRVVAVEGLVLTVEPLHEP